MVCLSQLPKREEWIFREPPEVEGIKMQFRLIYHGPLPSESGSNTRKKAKNSIRRILHRQLEQFWKEVPNDLGFMAFAPNPSIQLPNSKNPQEIAEDHKLANRNNHIYRFVPLIGRRFAIACSLDILFLRRDDPGGLIKHGGDIDNRLKVLFDALRVPQNSSELPEDPPHEGEDPFYCLMEDDKFITKVSVTTDRLYTPIDEAGEHLHDVYLVIGVEPVVLNPIYAPWKMWVR